MIKGFLSIILLLSLNYVYGQRITGIVIDNLSKQPVPYANIKFNIAGSKAISNADGVFVLEQLTNKTDTLEISSLGFSTLRVPVLSIEKAK